MGAIGRSDLAQNGFNVDLYGHFSHIKPAGDELVGRSPVRQCRSFASRFQGFRNFVSKSPSVLRLHSEPANLWPLEPRRAVRPDVGWQEHLTQHDGFMGFDENLSAACSLAEAAHSCIPRLLDEPYIEAVGDDGNPRIRVAASQASGRLDNPAREVAAVHDDESKGCALIASENRAFIGSRACESKTITFRKLLETYAHERVLAQENSLWSRILQADLNGPCSIRMHCDALIKGLKLVVPGNLSLRKPSQLRFIFVLLPQSYLQGLPWTERGELP